MKTIATQFEVQTNNLVRFILEQAPNIEPEIRELLLNAAMPGSPLLVDSLNQFLSDESVDFRILHCNWSQCDPRWTCYREVTFKM